MKPHHLPICILCLCFLAACDEVSVDGTLPCESDAIRCQDQGYVRCLHGEWETEAIDCPSKKSCTQDSIQSCFSTVIPSTPVDPKPTPQEPIDNPQCEENSAKCTENGYAICQSGQWSSDQECPSGNSPCTDIVDCLTQTSEPTTGCKEGAFQCFVRDSHLLYSLCQNGNWSEATECPNQDTSCDAGIEACFKVEVEVEVETCADGSIQCDPQTPGNYQTCKNNEWVESTPCPNPDACHENTDTAECLKEPPKPTELQCTADHKQLQVLLNDNWVNLYDCDKSQRICSDKLTIPMCIQNNMCQSDPLFYSSSDRTLYQCSLDQYKCIPDINDPDSCGNYDPSALSIYNSSLQDYRQVIAVGNHYGRNFTKDIIEKYKNSNYNVCYIDSRDSDAFEYGSTVCVWEDTHYSVYECNENVDGKWIEKKQSCSYCAHSEILIEQDWKPKSSWRLRNKYKLTAICKDYLSFSPLVCKDDRIQTTNVYGGVVDVADCASVGRKCVQSSDGNPKCE